MIAVGKARLEAKQFPAAIQLLESAVRQQPRSEAAHYNLMLAYRKCGPDGQGAGTATVLDKSCNVRPRASSLNFLKKLGEKTPGNMKGAAASCSLAVLAAANSSAPDFRDVATASGLTSPFPTAATQTKEYIIETTGSGAAFIDYDNDGLLDIFVVSGEGGTNRMYHNDGGKAVSPTSPQTGPYINGVGPGRLRGRLRQRRLHRSVRHLLGAEPPLPQRGGQAFRGRHRQGPS